MCGFGPAASEFGTQSLNPSKLGCVAIKLCQFKYSKEVDAKAELGVQVVYLCVCVCNNCERERERKRIRQREPQTTMKI